MRISDWSSDVCSSDLSCPPAPKGLRPFGRGPRKASFRRVRRLRRGASTAGSGNNRSRNDCPVPRTARAVRGTGQRSEEHTSELQSLMRISYAVFCLKKKKNTKQTKTTHDTNDTRMHTITQQ